MCYFPPLQYLNEVAPLFGAPDNTLPSSPKGLFSVLVNRHIVGPHFLDGIHNMVELEENIFNLIDHYPENNVPVETIFHFIQVWGGRTGRMFYCRQPFVWQQIEPLYLGLIHHFSEIRAINNQTVLAAANAVTVFYNALHEANYKWMGVAFITKHSRFWMHRNLPNCMLPVYDSTFSRYIMHAGTPARLVELPHFWQAMIAKAELEHVSLTALERQLFNHFRQANSIHHPF